MRSACSQSHGRREGKCRRRQEKVAQVRSFLAIPIEGTPTEHFQVLPVGAKGLRSCRGGEASDMDTETLATVEDAESNESADGRGRDGACAFESDRSSAVEELHGQ